jgi:polyhydroxybutyrate depolymerase
MGVYATALGPVAVMLAITGCGSDDGSSPGSGAASSSAGGGASVASRGGADVSLGGSVAGAGGAASGQGRADGPGANVGMKGQGGANGAGGANTGATGPGDSSGAANSGPSGGATGLGAAGSGSGADCDPVKTLPPGDHEFTLTSANGLTYRYVLVVPTGIVAGKKAPLALVWHALWSSPEETRGLTHIDRTMASYGMITVHPRSPDQSWDVGTCCTSIVLGRRRDETVFAKELLADVQSKLCVDTHRVYTAGFSNGGMISQMLACKMADVFAAAAPIGSTLTIPPNECTPSRPVPIYMINGTADPLVGYSASGLSGGLAVPDSFKTWADRDGCTGAPTTTLKQGKATCQTYTQCAGGADVTLCSVDGMGHCLPGMKTESPTNCLTKNLIPLGVPNSDIDGIDLSAQFLAAHSLP